MTQVAITNILRTATVFRESNMARILHYWYIHGGVLLELMIPPLTGWVERPACDGVVPGSIPAMVWPFSSPSTPLASAGLSLRRLCWRWSTKTRA